MAALGMILLPKVAARIAATLSLLPKVAALGMILLPKVAARMAARMAAALTSPLTSTNGTDSLPRFYLKQFHWAVHHLFQPTKGEDKEQGKRPWCKA